MPYRAIVAPDAYVAMVPESGVVAGYKKLRGGILATLEIPADARRLQAFISAKCRAECVRVIALERDGAPVPEGYDLHAGTTRYAVGEIVRPDSYDDDPMIECSHGIHFFLHRSEAEEWCE